MIGLDPAKFAGHSLRRGFVTSAALNGVSIAKIMAVTPQKDPTTIMRYFVEDIEKYQDHAALGYQSPINFENKNRQNTLLVLISP